MYVHIDRFNWIKKLQHIYKFPTKQKNESRLRSATCNSCKGFRHSISVSNESESLYLLKKNHHSPSLAFAIISKKEEISPFRNDKSIHCFSSCYNASHFHSYTKLSLGWNDHLHSKSILLSLSDYATPCNLHVMRNASNHAQSSFTSSASPASNTSANGNESCSEAIEKNPFGLTMSHKLSPFYPKIDFTVFEYDPVTTLSDITESAQWTPLKSWDPLKSRKAVKNYILHLRYIRYLHNNINNDKYIDLNSNDSLNLLSPKTASLAIQSLLRTKTHTHDLSKSLRQVERLLGSLKTIKMTDELSYALLAANGKTGNIGRTLNLLRYRHSNKFIPRKYEFNVAIQSIVSAGLDLRQFRNVYGKKYRSGGSRHPKKKLNDAYTNENRFLGHPVENPTRWLDAILINMHGRGVKLDIQTTNQMLNCFASTGRDAKASYWFYQIKQNTNKSDSISSEQEDINNKEDKSDAQIHPKGSSVQMKMNPIPHMTKVPSMIRDQAKNKGSDILAKKQLANEMKRSYCAPLAAAFDFAHSLSHGAYGHDPITLDLISYNTLIKACCYRGALWRALDMIENVMPQSGIEPDTVSYNSVMHGLARMGDQAYARQLLTTMTNKSIPVDKYTVQALVDASLNVADVSGAITFVQDIFNQHTILPPYTSHLKIMEFALSNNMIFEAKRHLYFMRQLWKLNSDQREIIAAQENKKIGKDAFIQLFRYYGHELTEKDFGETKNRWTFF